MTPERKKILYVITKSNFGGAQRYVYELATSPHAASYDVHIACGGSGILVEKLTAAGIHVHPIKSFERDINLKKEFSALRELYVLTRTLRPHVVHVNSSKAGGSGSLIARLCRVPTIIFTAHGWPFFERRNVLYRILMWALSYLTVILAHKTIVVSHYDKTHARMPLLNKRIVHIPVGVPTIDLMSRTEARAQLFTDEHIRMHGDDLWVVSTGELTHNKNLSLLLRSVRTHNETHQKKIFLALIGTGELEQRLKEEIAALNLTQSVILLGYVENVRAYLRAFDVFVIPSLKEGLPYGLLEAGSAGLYCIGSRVGGIPEVLGEAPSPLLIDPTDEGSLVRAFTYLTACVDLEEENKSLREHIEKTYNITQMLEKTFVQYLA